MIEMNQQDIDNLIELLPQNPEAEIVHNDHAVELRFDGQSSLGVTVLERISESDYRIKYISVLKQGKLPVLRVGFEAAGGYDE